MLLLRNWPFKFVKFYISKMLHSIEFFLHIVKGTNYANLHGDAIYRFLVIDNRHFAVKYFFHNITKLKYLLLFQNSMSKFRKSITFWYVNRTTNNLIPHTCKSDIVANLIPPEICVNRNFYRKVDSFFTQQVIGSRKDRHQLCIQN